MISIPSTHLQIKSTRLDFTPKPSKPPLESMEEEITSDSQLRKSFKQKKHLHKCLVTKISFRNNSYLLYSDFTYGKEGAVSDGSYYSENKLSSAAWKIEYNYGTQYIQGGGMVPGKSEDQNSYQGELGIQPGFMCAIQII